MWTHSDKYIGFLLKLKVDEKIYVLICIELFALS